MINSKIFKEYDIRGKYPSEISVQTAYSLGLAFVKLTKAKKIIVGRDARAESEKVFWPLVLGLLEGGAKVDDLGVCATPELFFAVGAKKYAAGCMVTASHSPAGETGFKFCDRHGLVYSSRTGLQKLAVLARKETKEFSAVGLKKKAKNVDFTSIVADYKKFVLSFIKPQEVAGLKVVLDASSGSGSRLADALFQSLPLSIVYLNFRAGDQYPDHGPNPLLPENQAVISGVIKKQRADLGVIFDGDGDRAVFIDEGGWFVQPYYINCLLAQIILDLKKSATIVADARLNLAIAQTIKNNGGKILVHRSGYANFIKTMTEKKLLFGCENSGHFMLNFKLKNKPLFVYGDAIIPILLVLKYLKQNRLKLSEAIKPFADTYVISGELNFKTKGSFDQIVLKLKKLFPQAKFSSLDGFSAMAPDKSWFFNLRPSQTEPVVRLNIEATSRVKLDQLKKEVISVIEKY